MAMAMAMAMATAMPLQLALADLPKGFRFHPTDEELVVEYLRRRAAGQPCPVPIIADVDIYKFDPWELPSQAWFGEREWYFFTPRDRKYPNGVRPNRSAASGFWKATGTDKLIHDGGGVIGVKKALVFYVGRAPRGTKTPWIMHEYRLAAAAAGRPYTRSRSSPQLASGSPSPSSASPSSMRLDEWVLCRIFSKTGAPSPDSPLLQDLLAADTMYTPPENRSSSNNYYVCTDMLLPIQEQDGDGSLPALHHCPCQSLHSDFTAVSEPQEAIMAHHPPTPTFGHQEQINNAASMDMINFSDQQQIIDSMLMDHPFFGDQPQPQP